MASSILTSTSSAAIESCISSETSPPSSVVKLLEISLISAQDLPSISKSMQTYPVGWVHPTRKCTTHTDRIGHRSPEWTEKFIFRLDKDQLENASLTVEIYTISWFRDVLIGTVRVLIKDLIAPLLQTALNRRNTDFMTLQLRRPSGGPQGKINIGVALLDTAMRSATAQSHHGLPRINREKNGNEKSNEKIELWKSTSAGSDLNREGSAWENGSEICSDLGPSASVVAEQGAAAADAGGSILEVMTIEEAKARGRYGVEERRRKGGSEEDEGAAEMSAASGRRRSRRHSDGGLFSCIAYGIEFTIVCGASKNPSNRKINRSSRKKSTSEISSN